MPEAPLDELAVRVFDAERAFQATKRTRDSLRAELLRAMEARGVGKLDMAGQGLVTLQPAGEAQLLDGEACAAKLVALGQRLRELGEVLVDDRPPLKASPRPASLRVTPRF